jgi:hypothetical protein
LQGRFKNLYLLHDACGLIRQILTRAFFILKNVTA